MSPKQQISAGEFIQDIRSGMTYSELLEKHKLSPNRIQRIFRGLIDGQMMTLDELGGRCALFDDSAQNGVESVRLLSRHIVNFVLPICEKEKPKTLGVVLDITEGGIGLKGIEATTGESKNFAIPANTLFDVAQVEFRAQCRWVNREEPSGKCIGGFEITNISPRAAIELRKLVQLIELANQVEVTACDEPSLEQTDRREQERLTVELELTVHEATNRQNRGIIVDVSEGGIGVKGLSAETGERKTLVIPAYHGFVTFTSIVMVAECRWTDKEGDTAERNSGFKVLQLTPKNALELAKLISTLSVSQKSDLTVR
jgi:c-di-GMP-binding flagellar brake protein YcgR